jgi:hypothetical protein
MDLRQRDLFGPSPPAEAGLVLDRAISGAHYILELSNKIILY